MKNADYSILSQISDKLYELEQTTSILEFMQVAHAEGAGSFNQDSVADALFHVYISQRATLGAIHSIIDEHAPKKDEVDG